MIINDYSISSNCIVIVISIFYRGSNYNIIVITLSNCNQLVIQCLIVYCVKYVRIFCLTINQRKCVNVSLTFFTYCTCLIMHCTLSSKLTDNTTCDLSLNVAVSPAVTLCETNDMATCSKGINY